MAPRPATRDETLDARAGADVETLTDDELRHIRTATCSPRAAARAGSSSWTSRRATATSCTSCSGRASGRPLGGPDFEDRTRFFVELVERIRAGLPELEIGSGSPSPTSSPTDPAPITRTAAAAGDPLLAPRLRGRPGGRGPHGGGRFLALLESLGVRLVNVTLGSPYYNRTCSARGLPPNDGYQPFADPLVFVGAHLDIVREAKAAYPELVFVGTSYTYLMDWLPNVAQAEVRAGHVDLVGLGRAPPRLPRDVLEAGHAARADLSHLRRLPTAPRNGRSAATTSTPTTRTAPSATASRRSSARSRRQQGMNDRRQQGTPRSWRSSRPAPARAAAHPGLPPPRRARLPAERHDPGRGGDLHLPGACG